MSREGGLKLYITAELSVINCRIFYIPSMDLRLVDSNNGEIRTATCGFKVHSVPKGLVEFDEDSKIFFNGCDRSVLTKNEKPTNRYLSRFGLSYIGSDMIRYLWIKHRAVEKIQKAWMRRRYSREKRHVIWVDDRAFAAGDKADLPVGLVYKIMMMRLKSRLIDKYGSDPNE